MLLGSLCKLRPGLLVTLLVGCLVDANAIVLANSRADYSEHATRLHHDLLANYNNAVAPRSVRVSNYSAAGTDVYLQLRFFKVEAVSPSDGHLRVKVWLRMSWSDLRLSWDPAAYGDVREIKFRATDITNPETTDIWLPDFTPYNSAAALGETFEPSMASVNFKGRVY